jgi:hypothetical protein
MLGCVKMSGLFYKFLSVMPSAGRRYLYEYLRLMKRIILWGNKGSDFNADTCNYFSSPSTIMSIEKNYFSKNENISFSHDRSSGNTSQLQFFMDSSCTG